jgi:hypothetical protein
VGRGPFLGSTLEKVKALVVALLEGLQSALYKLLQSFHGKVLPNRDWRRLLLVDDRFKAFWPGIRCGRVLSGVSLGYRTPYPSCPPIHAPSALVVRVSIECRQVVLPNLIAFFTLVRVPSRVLYKPALLPAVLIKAEGGLWAVIRRVKTALVLCSPHSSRDSRIILLVSA